MAFTQNHGDTSIHAFTRLARIICLAAAILVFGALPGAAAIDAKSFFEQGMEAYKSGNFGSAELLFRKIIDIDNEEYRDPAWFNMALSYYQRGKFEAALFEFRSFLNKCRTEQLMIDSRYWMGECLLRMKQYANAIEEFRRYLSRSKDLVMTAGARDRIGDIYFTQQRYDEALIEWEQAAAMSTDRHQRDQRLSRIGEAQYFNGRADQSLEILTPLLSPPTERMPMSRARLIAGQIFQDKGNHQRATQVLAGIPAELLAESPFNDARFFLARSWIALNNPAQAVPLLEDFVRVAKESKYFYEALYELGRLALAAGNQQEAQRHLDRVRLEAPRPVMRSRAARLMSGMFMKDSPERAIRLLTDALAVDDQDERKEIIITLGKTYLSTRQYPKAGEILDQFLRDYPHDQRLDEVVFLQGRICLERGEIERAIKLFESLGRDNPFSRYNRESLFYLALVNKARGNYKQAITALREYTGQKDGENRFDAFQLLVDIHLLMGDIDGAGRVVDVMMQTFPAQRGIETVVARYATVLMERGRNNQRYLSFISTRYPESEAAFDFVFDQANVQFDRKNFGVAADGYAQYLKGRFQKNRGVAYYRRIISLFNLQRYPEVAGIIEKGDYPAMSESQWQEIPLIHARAYYRQNILDRVYMILEKDNLRAYPPEDILMYIIGAIQVKDLRTAMETAEFLEKHKELFAEALFRIGSAYLREKNLNEAELFLTRVIGDCPGTRYQDHARLALAELRSETRLYREALALLDDIRNPALSVRMHSLMIVNLFDLERSEEARQLARRYGAELSASEQGLPAVMRLLDYAYRKNDLPEFTVYAGIMKRYRQYETYLDYLSGMMQYNAGNYQKALFHFGRAETDERYRAESAYHLGLIQLLVMGNRPTAIQHFQKVLALTGRNDVYLMRSKLQMAIISREMKNDVLAKQYLDEIMAQSPVGMFTIQAQNLAEEFGYSRP